MALVWFEFCFLCFSCGKVTCPFSDSVTYECHYMYGSIIRIKDITHVQRCFSVLMNIRPIWGSC